jgi:hypothetical protein
VDPTNYAAYNIYSLNLENGDVLQFTDVVGGCFTPVVFTGQNNRERMVFASYYKRRWQLFSTPTDKPLHAAGFDRELRKMRCRYGAHLIAAKRLVREAVRRRGQLHAVALHADQMPASSGRRQWLSFLGRDTAFYPGPAGATESELPLEAWTSVVADNPQLRLLAPDVEALLVRTPGRGSGDITCHLVPIDSCYELVGQLRAVWRGFDGGQEARERIDAFFARVAARSKPAPSVGSEVRDAARQ